MPEARDPGAFRVGFSESIEAAFGRRLLVDQAGRCELWLEATTDRPTVPEIGYYVTDIGAADAQALRGRVRRLIDDPPGRPEPMLPGEPIVALSLEEKGQTSTASFDPHNASSDWQEVRRRLSGLERQALKAVRGGLRAEVALPHKTGGPVEVRVRLTTVGTHAVSFYSPVTTSETGGGSMMLMAARHGVPESEDSILDHQFHELSASELTSEMPEGHGEGGLLLRMRRGTELELRFGAILDWPPGRYDVRLSVTTNGRQPDDGRSVFVRGRLVTPPAEVTIAP